MQNKMRMYKTMRALAKIFSYVRILCKLRTDLMGNREGKYILS